MDFHIFLLSSASSSAFPVRIFCHLSWLSLSSTHSLSYLWFLSGKVNEEEKIRNLTSEITIPPSHLCVIPKFFAFSAPCECRVEAGKSSTCAQQKLEDFYFFSLVIKIPHTLAASTSSASFWIQEINWKFLMKRFR